MQRRKTDVIIELELVSDHCIEWLLAAVFVVFQFLIDIIFHSVAKSFFSILLPFKICNASSFLGCLLISKWF